MTPIKGDSYAAQVHTLMFGIAGGLGDEYNDTRYVVGPPAPCKKGDGLLTVGAGSARVRLEMTDSARTGWGDYLDEAETQPRRRRLPRPRPRRRPERRPDHPGPRARRVVMAFDPENDDPRPAAHRCDAPAHRGRHRAARTGATEIATAEEKITRPWRS